MKVSTSAFKSEHTIPAKYTCDGENVNPPLHIEDIPPEARSLAVTVEDADSVGQAYYHWIMWNVPLIGDIEENSAPGAEGIHDYDNRGYVGPCPPSGTHRYVFTVYALDTTLDLKESTTGEEFVKAIENNIVGYDKIMGSYSRKSGS